MRLRLNKKTRKWLPLLFGISLLVNVQASYACAMMPDMSGPEIECCCGVNHRSRITDDSAASPAVADLENGEYGQDRICDEPRRDCCVVEVSVGVSDPPSGDEALTPGSTKVEQHKVFKQRDNYSPAFAIVSFETRVADAGNRLSDASPGPALHHHTPPLYKTTERYRI